MIKASVSASTTTAHSEEPVQNRSPAEHSRLLRREAQRAEILEAAAQAIAEHGYHGMTMRGLARATGKGLASFYNYFSSKEDLLFSLQSDAFETMTNSAKAALENVPEPVEQLYIFVLNYLRYAAEHKSVIRVLVHEASALPAGRRKTVRLLKEGYFNLCRDIVAAILTAGCKSPGAEGASILDPAEVERVTYSVFGMLNWSYGWYDPKQHGTPQDVARSIHSLAVCGLVAQCPNRQSQGNLQHYLGAIAPPPLVGKNDQSGVSGVSGANIGNRN
ncbi:MAG: TetR/AcrR family transcriptional regulator [Sterolibacterium sp.]